MRPVAKMELRSSVLIVAHPRPSEAAFGADFAADFASASQIWNERAYPVVAMPTDSAAALAFARLLEASAEPPQLVLVHAGDDAEAARRLLSHANAFRVLPSYHDARFERTVQEALEEHALAKQNAKLLQSVNEQNRRLVKLSAELEDRVEKRGRRLQEERARLDVANDRLEALHRALVAVHRARSAAEMERLINDALKDALGLAWTRISYGQRKPGTDARRNAQAKIFSVHSAALPNGLNKESLGEIEFARERGRPFARDEGSFLRQVAEAVALAIDRLAKLEESETLKQQWEATFDAIDEPVVILDRDRTISRTNRAFAAASGIAPEAAIGRLCHDALFGRAQPCEGCSLGANFRLAPASTRGGQNPIYQVFSQSVGDPARHPAFVHMYRDVAPQLRLESQILESAKMAELGTIGSSIAHELNNPLGGMLSFIQLIKMDLKGDEPWAEDVADMENGARRCRDIVQNLLGFARKSTPRSEATGDFDVREAALQALKIAELQTRALGVRVRYSAPDAPARARGEFNLVSQALRFFLQSAQDAIAGRAGREAASGARFQGEIAMTVAIDGACVRVEISDNGDAPERSDGSSELGLTVALDIVRAHGGEAQFDAGSGASIARLSFPRPQA